MPLLDIRPDHLKIVQNILQRFVPEREAWAFGLRAKWLAKEYSDLDLCIVAETPLSFRTLGLLEEAFEDSDLPYKVDVVDWAATSESFRKIIERDKVVVQEGRKCLGGASEWQGCTLGDVIELKRGYDLPQKARRPGSVPLVSSSGITDSQAESMVKGPGVVTGRYGTLGQVFYIEQDFWPLNTTLYVRDFKGNDPRFISYFLQCVDFLAYSDKAAVPGLNRNHLHQARARFPAKIEEQRAIAHILGTLDDKIELNRRMNETLEAMARALFKAWFVAFDPVRAKMEGRWLRGESLPGLPAHLYDLFPDRLVESELGEIPEGWEAGTLGDVAEHPRRTVQPDQFNSATPYIALEHMPKRCFALSEWGSADGLQSNKFRFKRGEILFGKLRPYFHKVGVTPLDGVCSTDIVVITPKSEKWFGFVLGHVTSDEFVEYTNAGSTGTKMPRTSWPEMSRYAVVLPPEVIAIAFNQHIQPMTEKVIAQIHESRSVAQLRGTLLPKLISGELRVQDAERIAGAMV